MCIINNNMIYHKHNTTRDAIDTHNTTTSIITNNIGNNISHTLNNTNNNNNTM